jgi:hypothetical protein
MLFAPGLQTSGGIPVHVFAFGGQTIAALGLGPGQDAGLNLRFGLLPRAVLGRLQPRGLHLGRISFT